MARERNKGIGAPRSVSLVLALSFVIAAFPLGGWACESWNFLTGEGGSGMFAVFFVLPVAAGALTFLATWRLTKVLSIVSGVLVATGALAAATAGARAAAGC